VNRRQVSVSARRNQLSDANRVKRPALVLPSCRETDFAILDDGSLVEMIADPDDPSRTRFAIFKDGNVQYAREVETKKSKLVPFPKDTDICRNLRLASGVGSSDSAGSLLLQIRAILSSCIDLRERDAFLLANFILSTWLIDRLPVAPYVAIVGLPATGKTTLLRLLRLLCRRSILTADITSAAFYRLCDSLMPTILIDETDTAGYKTDLAHLLKVGFTPDLTTFRKGRSFSAFGAKAMSWIELPPDTALTSRCIVVPLFETQKSGLKRVNDPEIVKAADELQNKFLRYRLEKFSSLSIPEVQGHTRLHSRNRDLYEALALASSDPVICEELATIFEGVQEQNCEPLPPHQMAVLRTLFEWVHAVDFQVNDHQCLVGDLTGMVNETLRRRRETFRMNPREVGAILKTFGIDRRRTRWGWMALLDRQVEERVHRLAFKYGLDQSFEEPERPPTEPSGTFRAPSSCEYCKASGGEMSGPLLRSAIRS
jgi:hypothetical protein